MTETQKRIQAYKDSLPGLRERVVAVALLLAMSMAMMTSASFAWLTISRSPEVSNVQTNVAANGNLEIALATGTGSIAPGESQVGDSSAAEDQTVPEANVTWGNLINLADPSYGLTNLTMRPAQLNKSDLLGSPLYGAVYSADGRVEKLTSNFSYTQWIPPAGVTPGYFGLSTGVGVRAISSTKVEAVGVWETISSLQGEAEAANSLAASQYITLTQNDAYMQSLAYIMGVFMTDRLNASQGMEELVNPSVDKTHLSNLLAMYQAFSEVFDAEAEALVKLLNLQLYLKNGGTTGGYTPYTVTSLLATNQSELNAKGLVLTNFNTFKTHYNLIKSDIFILDALNKSGAVEWQGTQVKTDGTVVTVEPDENLKFATEDRRSLKTVINSLVNLNSCTLDGARIDSIGATNASGYLNKSCQAVITNGVLYEFEKRTGAEMKVGEKYNNGKGLKLEARVKRSIIDQKGAIYAIITTSAEAPNYFSQDLAAALDMTNVKFEGTITAEDTYGMAIDLWVRTNAPASYLTLEGNVLTKTDEVQVRGSDANGNSVDIYTLSRTEEVTTEETDPETGETTTKTETVTYDLELYKIVTKDDEGTETTTWYNAVSHATVELQEGENPLNKFEQVVTVLGYEGENRVWSEDTLMSTDATTQGSGSCYVYYADTPEDQARSLKLLESFAVAFVDGEGHLMATAEMDTSRYYAESGRVTVPLKLSATDSINLGEDAEGNTNYAITALQQNVATRITAIVYLDGTLLTNDEVLAASDIQGQLNIQFGSTQSLKPIENEDLANKELRVSAEVDKTSFDYDTHVGDMISTVTVNVDGDEPTTVKAFFLRQISSTQGSREDEMIFKKNESGQWVATHKFTAPGKYVLRSVELDGISLDLSDMPEVNITGFALSSLTCAEADNNHIKILSAANSSTVNLQLKFAADDVSKLPKKVQGRFLNDADGSAVNINFSYNPTSGIWSGDATFLTSGDYTMEYLVLDGEYSYLPETMHLTADVTLGMRVAAWTTSPVSFKYLPTEMEADEKELGMQIKIMDNSGEEMPALSNVKLTYAAKGQTRTMDADLTWNGKYYVGKLATFGAGSWEFSSVVVGSNTLTTATTAPVFTIIPPDPPAYHGFQPEPYQYVPSGGAKLNVHLTNASTATVEAKLVNTANNNATYTVLGTLSDEGYETEDKVSVSVFHFTLPSDTVKGQIGVQDGNWVMEEIYIRGYFDAAGNLVSADKDEDGNYIAEPMVIDMRGKGNVTKAVQTVSVTIPEDKSQILGKTGDTVTGTFMTEYTDVVSGLAVDVVDFEGKKVEGISDITMTFVYGNNSKTYGGYTSTGLTNATADFTVTLKADSTGTHFVQQGSHTLVYAGTYSCEELTFSVPMGGVPKNYIYTGDKDDTSNNTKAMPAYAPTYEVWSNPPTATVTGTSPSGYNNTKITWTAKAYSGFGKGGTITTFAAEESKESKFDSDTNVATVYATPTIDNNGTLGAELSNHNGSFTKPTVKITVAGVGNSDKVSLTLEANGKAPAVTFSGEGNRELSGTLGHIEAIKTWTHTRAFGTVTLTHTLYAYYGYGEKTIDKMTVVRGTEEFTIYLPNVITINNPSSVNKTS